MADATAAAPFAAGLDAALAALGRAAAALALAGGGLVFAAALLVGFDVLARKVFSITVGGADELSGYALAIGSAWSFAHVLMQRGNVRIDALYLHLPRPAAAACDALALLALLVFGGLVAWHGSGVMAQSYVLAARSNSELGVPLVVPQAAWWAGWVFFCATALLLLLRVGVALARGDTLTVTRLVGARSVREDAADELAGARAALARHEGTAR
jgi:TRAP-type C4-dicarboxylate transport system permease small subunit